MTAKLNDLHASLVQAISRAQPPPGMTTKIVAIDGAGAAGKSTLAAQLSGWLGGVPIVNTDDFANLKNLLDRWPRLVEQVLEPLAHNRPAHYQRYDWSRQQLAEWHDIEPGGTVILEGVTSLRREYRPYLAYRIWVEAPADVRLQRGLSRDRGYPDEDNLERWKNWQAAEAKHYKIDQPLDVADIIVDNDGQETYHSGISSSLRSRSSGEFSNRP